MADLEREGRYYILAPRHEALVFKEAIAALQKPDLLTESPGNLSFHSICLIKRFFKCQNTFKKTLPVRLELTIYRLTVCRLNQLGHRSKFLKWGPLFQMPFLTRWLSL